MKKDKKVSEFEQELQAKIDALNIYLNDKIQNMISDANHFGFEQTAKELEIDRKMVRKEITSIKAAIRAYKKAGGGKL